MAGLIVHEWISRIGGSENVLDAMVGTFPDAEVLCLWNDAPDLRYPARRPRETWLAHTPLRRSKAGALPLIPPTWRAMSMDPAPDWILASSHLFAHHIRLRNAPDVPKYAYVYTPARYIWNPELDERGAGLVPRLAAPALRRLDRRRAEEPVKIAAISRYVRERIAQSWGRDSDVIYPPVEVERLQATPQWSDALDGREAELLATLPTPFILGASRFIPYKRLDVVIRAGEVSGLPVVLAGGGPDEARLRALADAATVPVHFVVEPRDALLYALFQAALVFVFPALEDFGIMPVEAMALGTPAVGLAIGGASETVVDNVTGASLPASWTDADLRDGVSRAAGVDPTACRAEAARFGRARFEGELTSWLGASAPAAAQPDRGGAA